MTTTGGAASDFELDAGEYDHSLNQGISVSGEDRWYFVRGRLAFLREALDAMDERPRHVLDFGCGSGGASPQLLETFAAESVLGVDVSAKLLECARRNHVSPRLRFASPQEAATEGRFDLAFCNGVFHHIPPTGRAAAVRFVRDSLRPGGLFALWDNNPWNPGTRYVMSRIPFDRDAVMISSRQARLMLEAEGFEVLRVDYMFVFPRFLSALRALERPLSRLPLGAQFQVLARRPEARVAVGPRA